MDAANPDIDRILEAIRAEARARGSRGRIGSFAPEPAAGAAAPAPGPVIVASHGIPAPDIHHVADLLALPIDVFITQAYERVLGRPPDAAGAAHWQRVMLQGRLTRVEILGRFLLSPEGRRRRSRIAGLVPALVLAIFYRVPVVGPVMSLLARVLRLPAFLQDRATLEATALASGSWMKR